MSRTQQAAALIDKELTIDLRGHLAAIGSHVTKLEQRRGDRISKTEDSKTFETGKRHLIHIHQAKTSLRFLLLMRTCPPGESLLYKRGVTTECTLYSQGLTVEVRVQALKSCDVTDDHGTALV